MFLKKSVFVFAEIVSTSSQSVMYVRTGESADGGKLRLTAPGG